MFLTGFSIANFLFRSTFLLIDEFLQMRCNESKFTQYYRNRAELSLCVIRLYCNNCSLLHQISRIFYPILQKIEEMNV